MCVEAMGAGTGGGFGRLQPPWQNNGGIFIYIYIYIYISI